VHDAADLVCALGSKNLQRILGGLACVDDQGLPTATGGFDMGAEPLALPSQIAGLPIVVKARLPNRDDSRMCRQLCESLCGRLRAPVLVRMYPD
jgi:hypothetical protein